MKYKLLPVTLLFLSVFFAQKKDQTKINLEKQKTLYLTSNKNSSEQALVQFAKLYDLNDNYSFEQLYSNEDRIGQIHRKYGQFYKGIKVEFGTVITHSKEGKIRMINGELYNANELSLVPQLSANVCLQLAIQKINATTYLWQNEMQAKLMDYKKPKGELVIFPDSNTETIHLAYKYDIYATNPISRQEIYVDANNGQILFSNQIIKHATSLVTNKEIKERKKLLEEKIIFSSGTADTRYSGTKNIETTFNADNSNYTLRDQTRGSGIFTFNCQNSNTFQNVDFTDDDNNWSSIEFDNVAKDNGALDAHWGAETTYDFWSTIFGRNSFDDNGGAIRSYVHYGMDYNNASWNGFAMSYGDGDSFDILTSIDVCGHEIGHAVCTYTANLVYQNESGAMNEGFSDIWGACIEHYGRTGGLLNPIPSSVWLIGEDIASSALRSMEDPNSRNDPDTYLGTNWYSDTGDSGGVHTNSGVLNHWFYILTIGKSGTNNAPIPDTYSVTGIGMQKASEIAYLAERDYLTPNSTYADARNATITVANDLYCANSPEAIAVTNAWFAVNIGDEYVAAADDVALQAIDNSETISCTASSITTNALLKNQGLNLITSISISYTVDGNNPVNTTWTGNLAPCSEAIYPITVNGLTRGTHNLSVTTTIVNDGRPENNTKEIILLINDQGSVGVINEFTSTSDELISYNDGEIGSLWTRGIHTDSPTNDMDSNGNTVYTTNTSGNYPDNTKAYLISQCYNLSTISNPEISFSMKYDLENNWDIVYVEYSTDFGANWAVLGYNDISNWTNWYNSDRTEQTSGNDCFNCPGAQWTGTNTTLTTYTYPLQTLSTQSSVIFRIVFHSDQAVHELGVNIDDFVINGTLSSTSFNQDVIAVYPNPSNGIYTISLGNVQPISIKVYDISGKTILFKKDILVSENRTSVNLTAVSKGIYFIVINSEKGIISKRIVKE
ncbi:T9SS type A sorting domain-containing protein [Flavobacterium jejuense]|uniref:T9SS type A sorting domain-containing protein n=1 Tax=Flavobacterium jejuense TaxID=1544455 RepID=A0ABX0IQ30_9FLAO|nr:M4 family metallopeptidase [Flavobacterium jejuense]NHN25671.1 T9SS type A sorting domain-containing protein [Flavobacterium jejuense]